jgi:hypothetical protein
MNVTGSKRFQDAHWPSWDVNPFPDKHAKLVIVELTGNNFVLQVFGRRLTNEVLGTIPGASIGAGCKNLAPYLQREPTAWFIDDHDFTKDCVRECAITGASCRAWKITPAP